MITNREMLYVNQKEEEKIPYPGKNYAKNSLLELKEALQIYNTFYKNKMFEIAFSNGQNLEFQIETNNFPHLVGLPSIAIWEKKGFLSKLYSEKTTTFNVLVDIANNIDDFIKFNEENNHGLFNFYRMKVRSEIFSDFSNFTDYNFGVMHFDKNNASKNGYITTMNAHTFLFVEGTDINYPYHMMGIAKDKNSDNQYVETLFPVLNAKKLFEKQTITFPTAVAISQTDLFSKTTIDSSKKLKLIKQLMDISKNYNANFDYFHDYLSTVSEAVRNEEKSNVLKLTK